MKGSSPLTIVLISLAAVASASQEPVMDRMRRPRALNWDLEDSLRRQGYLASPQPDYYQHHDSYAMYDHGLDIEHQPMVEGHRPFYRGSENERRPDSREDSYRAYRDHMFGYQRENDVFRNALCFSDLDCEYGYTCEVIDSYNHVSECVASHIESHHYSAVNFPEEEGYHVIGEHGEPHGHEQIDDGQLRNTERGHFELGYWCLKNTDCESKHCAQVGPRLYDKEC